MWVFLVRARPSLHLFPRHAENSRAIFCFRGCKRAKFTRLLVYRIDQGQGPADRYLPQALALSFGARTTREGKPKTRLRLKKKRSARVSPVPHAQSAAAVATTDTNGTHTNPC